MIRYSLVLTGLIVLGGPAAADVYPTGNPATDTANVQAALDLGGTVLLKATDASGAPVAFAMGSFVARIRHDVIIQGETIDGVQTEIRGGGTSGGGNENVFSTVSLAPNGLNITIRGIYFNGPNRSAVSIGGAHDVTISGNKVRNCPENGLRVGNTNGTVEISGNQVGDPAAPEGEKNPAVIGIGALPAGGTFRIADNAVAMALTAAVFPYGIGIRVTAAGASSVDVTHNVVHVTNKRTSGIIVASTGPHTSIEKNVVYSELASVDTSDVTADVGAIVVNGTQGVYVGRNRVWGTAFCGVCLYGSSNGAVVGNNLNGLVVPDGLSEPAYGVDSGAALVFGVFNGVAASDNTAVGSFLTVFDAGTGNMVTGVTPMKGGAGQAVSSATQEQ